MGGTTGSLGAGELAAVYDTLMKYDPEAGRFVPRMASSLVASDDLTEWTLTLRDDITFGNGKPVDSEAVRFSVNRHRGEDTTSVSATTAALVKAIDVVDDRTLTFTLAAPWGNFPSLLAGPVGMVIDPGAFEELGAEGLTADPGGAGAGPFTVERYVPGEELVLAARDDYWGGAPCIDELAITYGLDDTAALDAVRLGELDVAFLRSPAVLHEAETDGLAMHTEISNGGYVLQMNHGAHGVEHPTGDLRVRQAIAHALDIDRINEIGFGGYGLPGTGLVPQESGLYSPDTEGLPYDPDRARSRLQQAMTNGFDGSVHFLCNQSYADSAIAITGLLEAVGFTVDLEAQITVAEWVERMLAGDYDIACGSVAGVEARPWSSISRVYDGVYTDSSRTGYESDAMQDAMSTLRAAESVDEQRVAMAAVQRVWNEDVAGAIYGHAVEAFVWSDDVEGLDFSMDLIPYFDDARQIG